MISKLSAILLGVFAEKELSAYELIKLLDDYNTSRFYPIGESTVYSTVKKLEKQGLITGKIIKQEKLPSKTVYAITEKGIEELHETISSYLDKWLQDGGEFEIGMLLSGRLRKDEIMKKLKHKLHELEKLYFELRKIILVLEQNRNSTNFTTIAVLKHRKHLIEAERKTINELIKEFNIQRGKRTSKYFYDLRITQH